MSSSGSDQVLDVPKDNEKDDQRPLDSRAQPPPAETDKPPASSSLPETTQPSSPPSVKDTTLTSSTPPPGSSASPPDTDTKITMDGGDTKDDTTKGAVDDEKKQSTTAVNTKDPETKAVASNGSAIAKDGNGDAKHDKSASTATATGTPPKNEKTSLEKPAKKKKGRRKNLWRFLNSCFTSSVLEDSGTEKTKPFSKSSKSKKTSASPNVASKEDEKPKDKSAGQAAEAASISSSMGAALTLNTKPATPSRRSSAIVNGDGDVVIPPAHAHDLLPKSETAGVTSGAVQAPGSTGSEEESEGSATDDERHRPLEDDDDEERLILNGGNGIPIGPDGKEAPLLPPLAPSHKGRKCLVLDLDETLVHSSFKLIPQADYVVPVEIEWQWHNVYVIKRPGVDAFLKRMGELYEIVVFTASLSKYADPVLDKLDIHKVVSHRLFRESCYLHKGNYVKDLSQLGRPIGDTIILDNSPASYIFHPNNAVPVSSWFNDPHDTELTDMSPFLADLAEVADIRGVLDGGI